jgi:hypothetical protein
MSHDRISQALAALFASHNAVFWHDVEGEFSFSVQNQVPESAKLICLDDVAPRRQAPH